MRLTVGPLPASVYWRRRLVVLAGFAMVGLVSWYAFSGPSQDTAGSGPATPAQGSAGATAASAGIDVGTTPSPAGNRPPPFTLPGAPTANECTDADLKVTASTSADVIGSGGHTPDGAPVRFTITIRNISSRQCDRDVGADEQELRLVYRERIVWSSDDCDSNSGSDVRTLTPGQEISFTPRGWTGTRTRTGDGVTVECSERMLEPEVYRLYARLGEILSPPVEVHITAP